MFDLVLKARGYKLINFVDKLNLPARQLEIVEKITEHGPMGAFSISNLIGLPTCQSSVHAIKLVKKGVLTRKKEIGLAGTKYIYELTRKGAKV